MGKKKDKKEKRGKIIPPKGGSATAPPLFKPEQRTIFQFDVFEGGTRIRRFADPMEVMRRLKEPGRPDIEELRKELTTGMSMGEANLSAELQKQTDSVFVDALNQFADSVCYAFGVDRLHNADTGVRGCTHVELLGIYTRFLRFMGGLAETARPLLNSPSAA